jgi:hypothetical protein
LHGKAAQISTWTFHSVRIFASLIHRKYTAQNVALPKWWTQWLAFVDICALVRPAFTNERWARTLGNRVAEHMEMVMALAQTLCQNIDWKVSTSPTNDRHEMGIAETPL